MSTRSNQREFIKKASELITSETYESLPVKNSSYLNVKLTKTVDVDSLETREIQKRRADQKYTHILEHK
jgi:hypothetical protein